MRCSTSVDERKSSWSKFEYKPEEDMAQETEDNKKDKDKLVTIYMNTEPREVEKGDLTYAQVVALEWGDNPPTGPNVRITITYEKAASKPHDGSLLPGGSVEVKQGTRFNARATDQS